MKLKVKLVKQIYINGALFSKPERAAWAYSKARCQEWWQVVIQDHLKNNPGYQPVYYGRRNLVAGLDVDRLKAREVRMYKRVLPIFKKMLAD
jgi:hypothetical protein